MNVPAIINIEFDTGEEVSEELYEAVMKASRLMTDKMNNGAIDRYNQLTEFMELDQEGYDDCIDAYEILSNACWSSELRKMGYRVKVLKEVLTEIKIPGHKPNKIMHEGNNAWKIHITLAKN